MATQTRSPSTRRSVPVPSKGRRQADTPQARFRRVLLHIIAITVGLTIVIPVLYGVLSGFKDNGQMFTRPFGLPDPWRPENFTSVLGSGDFWRQIVNSLVIAIITAIVVVMLSAMAAFVFARFSFPGREIYFTVFAIGLMFPFAVALLPLYVILSKLELINNPLGVILPQAAFGLPVTIIILRSFFRSIPAEVEEAAILDGCTTFGFFWRILLPMARPALATVSVLAVVGSWNNFLLPLVVFNDSKWYTLPLGVQQFQGQFASDNAKVLAYTMLAIIPALLFYSVAERQLVGGLTSGATKG
jgi:raffinose/stachyose/melibiose transport system permease protein